MNQSKETVKLISTVLVSERDFPLALSEPDGLNNGGYVLPFGLKTGQAYSPIDMLVAGLEAYRLGEIVTNLTQFFDKYRVMWAPSQVHLVVKMGEEIRNETLASWKLVLLTQPNRELERVMKRNAPLTFKWR